MDIHIGKDENWCISHYTKKKGLLKVDANLDVKVKKNYISYKMLSIYVIFNV